MIKADETLGPLLLERTSKNMKVCATTFVAAQSFSGVPSQNRPFPVKFTSLPLRRTS